MANRSIEMISRVLDQLGDSMTPEFARKVLSIQADEELEARLEELADKSNEGLLTEEERGEYDQYLVLSHMLAKLHFAARKVAGPNAA